MCGHGTDNVHDEAAWLTCHALGLSPLEPLRDRTLDDAQVAAVTAWIEQRIKSRRPAAYLIGEAWFAGLPFTVNESVLVPRSPIAELIAERFEPWIAAGEISRVLDLCTGSGCIGIATALALPRARIDLADISKEALAMARLNIQRHQVADRVDAIASDFFAGLSGRQYDLIVSNPPYVPRQEAAELPREYLAEPMIGLASGEDGLDAACTILNRAATHLRPGGQLILEVGDSWRRLQQALPTAPFMWLEFEHGGDGVLMISQEELHLAEDALIRWREERKQGEQ